MKQAGQILFEMIETLNSKGSLHKDDVRNLISMIKMNVNKNGNKQELTITIRYVFLKRYY